MQRSLFDNGSNPYNASSKDKYHLAIKNTLLNIQKFIREDFGLDIQFKDQNDTWQMGKTLSTILFPQYLDTTNIQDFTSFFKEYNLNINDKFSWLGGSSPLGAVLRYLKFDLANALVKNGTVLLDIKSGMAFAVNMDLLDWLLENAPEIDINLKDQEGMRALDYAEDPQIISKIISLGAIAYPVNHDPICPADYENPKDEDDTAADSQLFALEKLLMFYNQDYTAGEEDAEFIVRLPQIIADDLYEAPIVEIFAPLAEYWEEVITPAAQEYVEKHDISGICSPIDMGSILFM